MKQRLEVSNIYFCGMRCIENKTDLMKEWWCGSQYEQLNDVAKIVLNSLHSRFMGHINYEGSQFCCSPFIEYNADINFFFFFFLNKNFHTLRWSPNEKYLTLKKDLRRNSFPKNNTGDTSRSILQQTQITHNTSSLFSKTMCCIIGLTKNKIKTTCM
jgi:hypothetical protein